MIWRQTDSGSGGYWPAGRRFRAGILVLAIFLLFGGSGCRRAPSTEPERYARETVAVAKPGPSDGRPLPAHYPWQRGSLRIEGQGERFRKIEQSFREEIRAHDHVMNGESAVIRKCN